MAQQTIVIEVPGTPISGLPESSSVTREDTTPVVQGGETKQAEIGQISDLVISELGTAALKNESDFATPSALASAEAASQARDDALHERVDTVEYNSAVTSSGRYTYKTYDIAVSKLPTTPINSTVYVSNDTDDSKNIEYTWDGVSLTPQKLSLLNQTKGYVDQSIDNFAPDVLRTEKAVFGDYQNYATNLLNGYIDKTTGNFVAATGWHATNFIRVINTTLIFRVGASIAASSAAVAMALYDKNRTFLGVYSSTNAYFEVTPALINASVAFVRLSYSGDALIYAHERNILIDDFFTSENALLGYVTLAGTFVASATWKTTPYIPCKIGQKFSFVGAGNAALVSSVSLYDDKQNFLESVFATTSLGSKTVEITNPSAKYIRSSGPTNNTLMFKGMLLPSSLLKQYSTIVPTEVYALKNQAIYLYSDGIVGNADNLAWSISESNEQFCKIVPTTADPINVEIRTTEDRNNKKLLASLNVLVTDTPINPATKRFVIPLGDSLTEGISVSGISGAYANELSRRLNGVGRAILEPEGYTELSPLSPPPLAMNNLEFIGTLGNEIVKHEGRGGWRASHYLNNATLGELTNAFWNPTTSSFDLSYYLAQNGFTGINATGSNLTFLILLGWNDAYNTSAKQGATDLGLLIDKIHSTHPDVDIICLGLNQAPLLNAKTYTGKRFVSKREVFEIVRQFNNEYKAMIATKSKVDFLQISCSFNSSIGYNFIPREVSSRSTNSISASFDHVHPNGVGYAMIADAVFYKLLYKYCR